MNRIVMTAALLAAFAMPAFAEDTMIRNDNSAKATKLDQTTTSSVEKKQTDMAPTAVNDNAYSGCMHRKNTALNMM